MFSIFERHPVLSVGIVGIMLTSVIVQFVIGNVLGHMVLEAENMASTENKQLKQFKLKFMNCYKMNEGMGNVTVFVERFLEKIVIGKWRVSAWHRLSGQMMLFAVLLSGVGAAKGIVEEETIGQILPFYVIAFMGIYIYYVSTSFAGIEEKKLSLKFSLVDYLENHMVGRLKQTEEVLNQKLVDKQEMIQEKEKTMEKRFSEKEKQELEALLREFLT